MATNREKLIKIAKQAAKWSDDFKIGQALVLLMAGADYYEYGTTEHGIPIEIRYPGFSAFECGTTKEEGAWDSLKVTIPFKSRADQIASTAKHDYTLPELLSICERAVVPVSLWRDRDSASCQEQLGECWQQLLQNKQFRVRVLKSDHPCITDERTIWLAIEDEGYYLPTEARLKESEGKDWY